MWYKIDRQRVELYIHVKPNAKNTRIIGVDERGLQIALCAKPHDGAANQALIAYIAELLRVPKREVVLLRGKKSRYKQLSVPLNEGTQQLLNSFKII